VKRKPVPYELKKLELPNSVPPKSNTALYNMIRYRGRKRWNLVRNYIEHFSSPNEVILDPFAGCGVVSAESLKTERRAIYNDLNPLAFLIGTCSTHPASLKTLKNAFTQLTNRLGKNEFDVRYSEGKLKFNMNWLYGTKCSSCGREASIREVIWSVKYEASPNNEDLARLLKDKTKSSQRARVVYDIIREQEPILHTELVERCKEKLRIVPWAVSKVADLLEEHDLIKVSGELPTHINLVCKCGAKSKQPDKADRAKVERIEQMEPAYFFPKEELIYPSGKRFLTKRRVSKISELYVKRTLIALSIVRMEMERISSPETEKALDLVFAALAYRTTKPESVNRAWMEYWIPRTYLELNVLRALKERCRRVLAGTKEINDEIEPHFKEGNSVEDLVNGKATALFLCQDAKKLSLNEDTIDYVFTDPSYGEAVQYFELSLVGTSWLRMHVPFEDEIIVNSMQNKDSDKYKEMLRHSFNHVFKALKPSKFMTVTFHSPDIRYWNALMFAITSCGFKYAGSVYQSHSKVYTNWMMAKDKPGTMLGDMYITFQKPAHVLAREEKEVNLEQIIKEIILPEARRIIMERGEYATYEQLVRGITLRLLEEGCLHRPEIVNINYEKLFDEHFVRVT